MKILNRIYLVLAVLLGIAGIVQCVRWSNFGSITIVAGHGYLLNFLPAITLVVAYVAGQKVYKKATHVIAIPLCLTALIAWGFITLGVEMIISSTTEVTDRGQYEEILGDYWSFNEDLVAHFPIPIPAEARNVKFSFFPGFLQGGTHVQLRYSLPSDEIAELYARFYEKKTKSFFGGNMNGHMNMKEGMPTTFFYTSGSDDHEFPHDFEIMIFDEVLKEENRPEGHYWNHGQSHGIAISKTRNEIVYWAEA